MTEAKRTLPTGVVTFLLTDIEGSTRQWEEYPHTMGVAVARHEQLIAEAVEGSSGVIVRTKGEGDSTFSVFTEVADGLRAATAMQRALAAERWPEGIDIRARAALYTGEAEVREGTYYGIAPNRCGRLRSVAHGGQIVVSRDTVDLLGEGPPDGITLRDLGLHRLKDLSGEQRVFQVCYEGGTDDFAPLQSLDTFVHSLPAQRTTFVGREKELGEVGEHLAHQRLITLIGLGGCGKTRLALHAAAEHVESYPDGVFFVDLSPLSDSGSLVSTVADGVGLARGGFALGTGRSVREELIDRLAPRHALVVLDNCEHLIDSCAELVDDLLASCPSLTVLATSREALRVDGEHTFSVPPLSTPDESSSTNGVGSDAVQLFRDRASANRSTFRLNDDNIAAVRQICRQLDGIPLAIELAAAQIAHLSPEQIVERMHDRFRLLTGGRRVQRQQTLRAMLDWSHHLLTPGEQRVLRRLAPFAGGFTLLAAEEVCTDEASDRLDVVDLLGSLVRKSLVVVEERSEGLRYRLLETVRLYAEDKLVDANEAEAIRARHRDWLLAWAEAFSHAQAVSDRFLPAWVAERDNIRGAIEWSAAEGRLDLVGRLTAKCFLLLVSASDDESERWVSLGLREEAWLEPQQRLELLSIGSLLSVMRFDADTIHTRSAEAIELARTEHSPFTPLAVYSSAARLMSTGDVEGAHEVLDHALGLLASERGLGRAILLGAQADLQIVTRHYEASIAMWDETFLEFERVDVPWAQIYAGCAKTIALHLVDEPQRALEAAEATAAVHASAPQGFPVSQVWCGVALGIGRGGVGDADGAKTALAALVEAQRRRSVPGAQQSCLIVSGALEAQRGNHDRAARFLAASGGVGRSPSIIALYRHYRDVVRDALGSDDARRYRDEGREMSTDEAVAEALR